MEGLAALIFLLPLYFLPAIIASRRKHQSSGGIFALNLLLGWTFLGWVIALVWSCSAVSRPYPAASSFSSASRQDALCPYCRAGVDPQARKCPHCSEWIEGQKVETRQRSPQAARGKPGRSRGENKSLQDVQSLSWKR